LTGTQRWPCLSVLAKARRTASGSIYIDCFMIDAPEVMDPSDTNDERIRGGLIRSIFKDWSDTVAAENEILGWWTTPLAVRRAFVITLRHGHPWVARPGKTLDELGVAMGYKGDVARKAAWQFLNKTADPRLSMPRRFAKAMDIPIADLIDEKKSRSK
jgi:hypothetical protein